MFTIRPVIFSLVITSLCIAAMGKQPFKIAIIGLGSRSQQLMVECLKLDTNIQVVAVCDDHAAASYKFFCNKLRAEKSSLVDAYIKAFDACSMYSDDERGLQQLFAQHQDADIICITSANYHHARHLREVLTHCPGKRIYIEKPLVKSLEELGDSHLFDNAQEADILVGLTLRYSTMATIVVKMLQEYKDRLGTLQQVYAWERVRLSQALTNFMMSWRRYISLSGGFLLEKSIHDLDLTLFFIQSIVGGFKHIAIETEVDHRFFTHGQKDIIINRILADAELRTSLIGRERSMFQRFLDYTYDVHGEIDWRATLETIFAGLPEDDNFNGTEIIPDYHKLHASITTPQDTVVDVTLEVELGGYRPTTQRGIEFTFQNGRVAVDVMASTLDIELADGTKHQLDLNTFNNDHADGDLYIAHAILGSSKPGQYVAKINDPIVALSTMMGIISEYQAAAHKKEAIDITINSNIANWLLPY